MSRRIPLSTDQLRCRDGHVFYVHGPHSRLDPSSDDEIEIYEPGVRVRAVPEDPAVGQSGLARYWRHHDRREGIDASYTRVPVSVVRAFVRLHGGVEETGTDALAVLKRAAASEKPDPLMGAPVAEQTPAAVEEAAAESPLPQARGAERAGAAEAPAAPRASDQPGAPALVLDDLTPAVIEGRHVVADFAGPLEPLPFRLGHRRRIRRR